MVCPTWRHRSGRRGLVGAILLMLRSLDRAAKWLRDVRRDALLRDSTNPKIHGLTYRFHRTMDNHRSLNGTVVWIAALCWRMADGLASGKLRSSVGQIMRHVVLCADWWSMRDLMDCHHVVSLADPFGGKRGESTDPVCRLTNRSKAPPLAGIMLCLA